MSLKIQMKIKSSMLHTIFKESGEREGKEEEEEEKVVAYKNGFSIESSLKAYLNILKTFHAAFIMVFLQFKKYERKGGATGWLSQ